MASDDHAWTVDEVARDLDLLVFELEVASRQPAEVDPGVERERLRKRLERLRDRLQDLHARMTG